MLHLLMLLKVRRPVHVRLLRDHKSRQLVQVSTSLKQHAWPAWGEAGEAATLRSRGELCLAPGGHKS